MEKIIEIGSDEEKRLIAQELRLIEKILENYDLVIPLNQIIISDNFDKRVNDLQERVDYQSIRGNIRTIAKLVETGDGLTLIFSPVIYTSEYDQALRVYFYLHEIFHVANKQSFPDLRNSSGARGIYLNELYRLFDEYSANRSAFNIIDSLDLINESPVLQEYLNYFLESCIDLATNPNTYSSLKNEIIKFRSHGDVNNLLDDVRQIIDQAMLGIFYSFSYIDTFPNLREKEIELLKSKFIDRKVISLTDFFREKYESHNYELADGIDLIIDFFTNYGIKFEDLSDGMYCHILNI